MGRVALIGHQFYRCYMSHPALVLDIKREVTAIDDHLLAAQACGTLLNYSILLDYRCAGYISMSAV